MAVLVTLPNLGDHDAEGVLAEWYRADGSMVDVGELVCRVESSFVAFEVEADGPGILHHRTPAGGIERSGGTVAQIVQRGESVPDAAVESAAPIEDESTIAEKDLDGSAVELEETRGVAFEDHLVDPVVLPFPGAFAGTASRAKAPDDPVEFDPALFGEAEHERTTTLVEPGGSIPGLPLWEVDEMGAPPTPMPVSIRVHERLSRIAEDAAASSQVLSVSVAVNLREAGRMLLALQRHWRTFDESPVLEDIVFRAIALGLEGTLFAGCDGAMVIANRESDRTFAVGNPAALTFREAVTARAVNSSESFESAWWLFVSLRELGVAAATSRLEGGRAMSFALASPDDSQTATLTMTYNSAHWSEGSAARLLAAVRDILEVPYTMLT